MADSYVYAFVHGFLEDTNCRFGYRLQKELRKHGIDLELIDAMGGYTFRDCSVSSGVAALDTLYEQRKKPLRLIGISMGGFIAANYTMKFPQNVDRLVLLNPVVNLESVWYTIVEALVPDASPEDSMEKWKEEGQLAIQGIQMKAPEPINYDYVQDSLTYPAYPLVDMPIFLIVGVEDFVIPLALHQEWKRKQKHPDNVNLVEVEDGHLLQLDTSWEEMVPAIVKYFA